MNIRALIFDFGNVVGFFSHHRATERLLQHSSLSREELHARIFGSQLEDDYESGRLTTQQVLQLVCEHGQLGCDATFVHDALADIFWPNPDVCSLIPLLKPRYRLLLGSNTNDLHARQFTRQFAETLAHFDHLVLSHEVGARKPSAAFFAHCQRLAGCPAADCVFIDDLPANAAGATDFGMQALVYRDFAELREQLGELGVEV